MTDPPILTRLINQLIAKGRSLATAREQARAYLQQSGNLHTDGTATAKGAHRGRMTPEQRERDRRAKYQKGTTVTRSPR